MQQDVGAGHQLVDKLLPLRGLEVYLYALLAGVCPHGHEVLDAAGSRRRSAARCGVHLDDASAKVCDHGRAVRPGDHRGEVQHGHAVEQVGRGVPVPVACAGRRHWDALLDSPEHLSRVFAEVRRGTAHLAGRLRHVRHESHHLHRPNARVVDVLNVPVVEELIVLHALNRVQVRLGGDVAVLHVDLHPLVEGLLLHPLQYELSQFLAAVLRKAEHVLVTLVFQDPSQADGAQMRRQEPWPLAVVGVLEPPSVLGANGDVLEGWQRLRPLACGREPLGVPAAEVDG